VTGTAPLVPQDLYPFESHWFDRKGLRLHYLDEGAGEPVVMVHGNPTWSFYYRNLAKQLRGHRRVVVPDHIGCGYSDKPGDDRYEYTLRNRVDDLEALLDALGLQDNLTLVLHDWGGMIGMAYADRHPERVARLVLMNTAAFRMPAAKKLPWQLWLGRDTPVGTALIRGMNAFAQGAARTCCTRHPMSAALRAAYCAPYDNWADRIATLRFVQDIPLKPGDKAYDIVAGVEQRLSQFRKIPVRIFWGEKDFVFDLPFLETFQRHLPEAQVTRFPDCGHYVLEDAAEEIIPAIEKFLDANPLPRSAGAGTA
jgi:haloalkane dehalogenase